MKIVGIGACLLDTYIISKSFPKEDTKLKVNNVFKMGGGPVANALVTFAKLGGAATYLGSLSDDVDGRQLEREFKDFGVDTSSIRFIRDKRAFTCYIILSTDKATRTCLVERGNLDDDPSLIDLSQIDSADILHLDGNYVNQAIAGAKYAHRKGKLVSMDVGNVYPDIESILPYVDILITSEEFALQFTGEGTVENALHSLKDKYNPLILGITTGDTGGAYLDKGIVKKYKCYQTNAVDTNGAGDTFHGAFLYAFLQKRPLDDCFTFASALVSIKCRTFGVRNSIPTYEQVENFLKENK